MKSYKEKVFRSKEVLPSHTNESSLNKTRLLEVLILIKFTYT